MSDLMQNNLVTNLYGAKNNVELLLARNGEYYDYKDSTTFDYILNRYVCEEHVKELLTGWHLQKYGHIQYISVQKQKRKACSIPEGEDMPNHAPRKILETPGSHTHPKFLNFDEARAFLHMNNMVLHPGIRKNLD